MGLSKKLLHISNVGAIHELPLHVVYTHKLSELLGQPPNFPFPRRESETFAGAKEFMESHGIEVINLDLDECKQLMKEFIQKNPELWNEDIGEL